MGLLQKCSGPAFFLSEALKYLIRESGSGKNNL